MDHQGRRGHSNRKRRYRDDEDFGDRRNKRRHYEEPAHVKLRRHLTSLSESSSRQPAEEAAFIASLITSAAEDFQLQNTFLELLQPVVVEQPLRIPLLAAVVKHINVKNDTLVGTLISRMCTQLNEYIRIGSWREVKLFLRFIACLQPITSGDGIFPVLNDLFARAADLQTASAEDGLGIELVKIILLTVAYLMENAGTYDQEKTLSLLQKTEIIASAPQTLQTLVDPFVAASDEESMQARSTIALLQVQIQSLAVTRGAIPFILKSGPEEAGTKHELPSLVIPSDIVSRELPCLPSVFFSIFADQDIQTVPPETNVASVLIRDVLVDTINVLDYNRNAAAKMLIDMDSFFTPTTFAKRGTPFDKLRNLDPDQSTWKSEDMVIDAVFSQIAMLPCPPHKSVFYHSLLTEACKLAPSAIAPSLGRAIRAMYRNLGRLDLEVAYRFTDWFCHHLSNFGFTWKWTEWLGDLQQSAANPQKAFIIATLDKETRLSFSQRIRGTLPEEYISLIPESKDKDIPDYKYNSDDVLYAQHAREILRLIRSKGSDAELQEHLALVEKEATERSSEDPVKASTDVYVTCMCFAGAKSLSHVLNCIERGKERLLSIVTKDDTARIQIIDSVLDYWKERPGVGVNIVDKLLNYTILTPLSVVQWAFVVHLQQGAILTQVHVYELVAGTVDKVARRIRQIVTGRRQGSLSAQQIETLDQALATERTQFAELFNVIDIALRDLTAATTEGASHEQAERSEWARRWLKWSTRKLTVEQSWVTETLALPAESTSSSSAPPATTSAPVATATADQNAAPPKSPVNSDSKDEPME